MKTQIIQTPLGLVWKNQDPEAGSVGITLSMCSNNLIFFPCNETRFQEISSQPTHGN